MNELELEHRLAGADDMAKLLIGAMRNIGVLSNQPLMDKDYDNLRELLAGLRKLLEARYAKM